MKRLSAILLLMVSLTGCQGGRVADYWVKNSIDYSDYDAAQDRFAIFAEKAVVAKEADAAAAMDILFDKLKEDEVAYYIYTEWVDGAFYNPLSPCRNAFLYGKAVERILSDHIFSERECAPFLQRNQWLQFNREGYPATIPGVAFDGRRTIVLVLDLSCPTCREALSAIAGSREWADARRIAVCFGYGPQPDVPGWEYRFPEYASDIFDPELTPVYFVVSADGTVESTYKVFR